MGDDIDDRLSQYAKLMSNKPDDWTREPGHVVWKRSSYERPQTNRGAFVEAKKKELDQMWAAQAEQMSKYIWCGAHIPLTPAEKRNLFWMRVKAIVTLREPRRRIGNAWRCLWNGWEAEDPDSRDY